MTRSELTPLLFLLLGPLALGAAAEAEDKSPMTDTEISSALAAGCSRSHRIEHYRGVGNRYDVIGPLWLTTPSESRPRGVILPPFLRVYFYGRSRRCKKLGAEHVEEARALAGPEIWVVLWRYEDPPRPYESRTTSDQKVLRPTQVRQFSNSAWEQPVETRTRDRWVSGWFAEDWNERESLLASFAHLEATGALHVNYKVEENGRSYLRESAVFPLTSYSKTWWDAAFGRTP